MENKPWTISRWVCLILVSPVLAVGLICMIPTAILAFVLTCIEFLLGEAFGFEESE